MNELKEHHITWVFIFNHECEFLFAMTSHLENNREKKRTDKHFAE